MNLQPASRGMGTTVAAVLLHGDGLAVINVGDSPVLEPVDERLVQFTTDDVDARHGLVGIRPSAVTQGLGGGLALRQIEPHLYEDQVAQHRRLLLCTDGLTNFVAREHIAGAMLHDHPRQAVEVLLSLALGLLKPGDQTT